MNETGTTAGELGEQIILVSPEQVRPKSNIRFGLKKSRLEHLMNDILESGGVQVPCTAELLPTPENGFEYNLITGGYRHAAVARLNKEQKAGLKLPIIVRTVADAADLLRQQLRENDRENMSPMDAAVAIQQLRDAGVGRLDIMKQFPRPTGKGGKLEPASNAWVNMTADFLKLPKTIQTLIHEGTLGVKAAYELGKAPADKQQAIIDRALREHEKELKAETDAEKRLADALAREEKKNKRLIDLKAKREALDKESEEAKKKVAEFKEAAAKAYQATLEPIEAKTKAEAQKIKEKRKEAQGAAQTNLKDAEKAATKADNEKAKVETQLTTAEENARQLKAKLEKKREEAKKAKKAISQTDVKKAAKGEGATTSPVPLNAKDMREAINALALPGQPPKMKEIGIAIRDYFAGIGSDGDMFRKIAKVTGEKWTKPRGE